MHGRVIRARVRDGQLDAARRFFRETLAEALHAQPGHRGLLYLAAPANGQITVVHLWDTEAAMLTADEHPAIRRLVGTMELLLAAPPALENYPLVSVQL